MKTYLKYIVRYPSERIGDRAMPKIPSSPHWKFKPPMLKSPRSGSGQKKECSNLQERFCSHEYLLKPNQVNKIQKSNGMNKMCLHKTYTIKPQPSSSLKYANVSSQFRPISMAVFAMNVSAFVSSARNSQRRIRLLVAKSNTFTLYGQTFCVVLPMPMVPVSKTHNRPHLSALIRQTVFRPFAQSPTAFDLQSGYGMSCGEPLIVCVVSM